MRWAPSNSELEVKLQSKLNLPLRYYGGRNHARSPGSIGDEGVRLRKHSMVERVEEIGSKLKIDLFRQIEVFSRRQVGRALSRSLQNVLVCISEAAVGAVGNRKVVYVEPQVRTAAGKISA